MQQLMLPIQERPSEDLSHQQRRVLSHLRTGKKCTGYFARLVPAILKPSNRVGELKLKGYDIVNVTLASTGFPNGHAYYELREN